MSKPIDENSFEGGVGGSTGTLNYQTGYGTPGGGDASQTLGAFPSSDNNKAVNQNSNTAKDAHNTGSVEQDVNAIFSKRKTPTPDEIVSGIKYELGQQIKKDKHKAKETVLANLKKDPRFYTDLKMLNIDDESMVNNMTENKHPNDAPAKPKIAPNIGETKKIFTELAKGRDNKYVVNSGICDVMKQMWDEKKKRNDWRSGS